MTDSTASTWSEVCTSKMNCGFFRMLIQNRSGKLLEADAQVKYISTIYNVWDTNIYMSSREKETLLMKLFLQIATMKEHKKVL